MPKSDPTPTTFDEATDDIGRAHRKVTGLPSNFIHARRDPALPPHTAATSQDRTTVTLSDDLAAGVVDAYVRPDRFDPRQGEAVFATTHELFHAADKDLRLPQWGPVIRDSIDRSRRLASDSAAELATTHFMPDVISALAVPELAKRHLLNNTDEVAGETGITDVTDAILRRISDSPARYRANLIDLNRTDVDSNLEFMASKLIDARFPDDTVGGRETLQFHTAALIGMLHERVADEVDRGRWTKRNRVGIEDALDGVETLIDDWGQSSGVRGGPARRELDRVARSRLAIVVGAQRAKAAERVTGLDRGDQLGTPELGRTDPDGELARLRGLERFYQGAYKPKQKLVSAAAKNTDNALAYGFPGPAPGRPGTSGLGERSRPRGSRVRLGSAREH